MAATSGLPVSSIASKYQFIDLKKKLEQIGEK
jgi:hypothetical protein